MDNIKILGKINIKARHIASSQLVETTVSFEDRQDSIYYCWTFKDQTDLIIANRCLPIDKIIIDKDVLQYAIDHCKYSIDNYRIGRDKLFEIIEIQRL